jgi:hypothetical protein
MMYSEFQNQIRKTPAIMATPTNGISMTLSPSRSA